MNVNPIDLQVLFSKSVEQAANLGREDAVNKALVTEAEDIATRQSREAATKVHNVEDSQSESNRINEEGGGNNPKDFDTSKKKRKNSELITKSDKQIEFKRAIIENNKGKIIDIVD